MTEQILALEGRGATLEELLPFLTHERNTRAALAGELAEGFVWAGQSAGLIADVPTVAELIARIVKEAAAAGKRACGAVEGV